jgi:hypothetical protein
MEPQSLKGAMEIRPDLPRLSGQWINSFSMEWRTESENNTISILPDGEKAGLLVRGLVMLSIALVPVVFYFFWNYFDPPHNMRWVLVVELCGIVPILVGAGFIASRRKRELRAGAIFRYSRDKQEFQFLRQGQSLQINKAIRWDLVSGNWIRDKIRGAKCWEDPLFELHLVFQDQDKFFAMPVAGGRSRESLDAISKTVSEFTALPLERIEEPGQTWRNPYGARKAKPTAMESLPRRVQ